MDLLCRCAVLTLFALATFLFARDILKLIQTLKKASPDNRLNKVGMRFKQCLIQAFGHQKLRRDIAGIAHLCLFYPFLVLLLDIFELLAQTINPTFSIYDFVSEEIFNIIKCTHDLFAGVAFIACIILFIRRIIKRNESYNRPEAFFILALIAFLMATHHLASALLLANPNTTHTFIAPIAQTLASCLQNLNTTTLQTLYRITTHAHLLGVALFLVCIPKGKHLHIFAAFFNVFFANQDFINKKPLKTERYIDIDTFCETYEKALADHPEDTPPALGATKLFDLTWKQLLDPLACAQCQRCTNVCPVHQAGYALNPMEQNINLRAAIAAKQNATLLANNQQNNKFIATYDEIWQCTTCGACEAICPTTVEHTRKTIDIRRNLVFNENYPKELKKLYNNIERAGNPWGYPKKQRAQELHSSQIQTKFKILLFAGCSASYDPKQQNILKTFIKLLDNIQIPFITLQAQESCCGEPLRKTGNEMGFQQCVQKNWEQFELLQPLCILTICPHCAHTLRNTYPTFTKNGKMPPVLHALEFLHRAYKTKYLSFNKPYPHTATYHDPCYLSKTNDFSKQTRELLKAIPNLELRETKTTPQESNCCGAGGGHFFMEKTKLPQRRVQQLLKTEATTLLTACPFCYEMLDSTLKTPNPAHTPQTLKPLMNTANVLEIFTQCATVHKTLDTQNENDIIKLFS